MKARTTANVNFRVGPGIEHPRLATLFRGVEIETGPLTGDFYAVTLKGYVHRDYLMPVDVVPPARKTIGMHIGIGDTGPAMEVIARLAKVGSPVPLVTVINHYNLPDAIKRVSPNTFVIYRPVFGGGDPTPQTEGWPSGQQWFDRIWQHMAVARADAYQFTNEMALSSGQGKEEAERFARFYIELMQVCSGRGIRCTFGDLPVGHVEPWHVEALRPMFAEGERLGHIFNYHAYTSPNANYDMEKDAEWYAMRWVDWVKPFPGLRIAFGEAGSYTPTYKDVSSTLYMMQQFEKMLAPWRRQVIGAAWWTTGTTGAHWPESEWSQAFPAYEAWMTS